MGSEAQWIGMSRKRVRESPQFKLGATLCGSGKAQKGRVCTAYSDGDYIRCIQHIRQT